MDITHNGKIIKGVGGLYTVRLDGTAEHGGEHRVLCRAKGGFRHSHITPLVGDRVTVQLDTDTAKATDADRRRDGGGAVIRDILPRTNALIRPPMANLDILFVTLAAASPAPILSTVDKLISIAEYHKIEPVIVVTKADLDERTAQELSTLYAKAGFDTFVVGADDGGCLSPLAAYLNTHLTGGRTAAFAGASGIGKSTLMNRLFPSLSLSTNDVSHKTERGRHTTRHVELFALSHTEDTAYIADTPGFSLLDFDRFDFFALEDLPDTMREFAPHLGHCRYTKCSHTAEDGCAVLEAVKRGEITRSRHDSFCEMYGVLRNKKKW